MKNVGPYFIGVDFGTGGVRVEVIDSIGKVLVKSEHNYSTFYPRSGWAEQSPSSWWVSFSKALGECMENLSGTEKSGIKAIGVCATSSTVLSVDSKGSPLNNAILWMDTRSADEAATINSTQDEVLKYCGGEVSSEWIIPKILWMKHHDTKTYERAYKIIEQLDWINLKLSGQWVTSKCNATCKWNYIDTDGGWQDRYFKRVGFEDYADKLVLNVKSIGEPVGKLLPEITKCFGLPENIILVEGGIDAHVAALGLGIAGGDKIGTIMGTSFVHLAFSRKAQFQKGIWGPYHNAVLPGYWLLEGGQISAGGIVKWFNSVFNVQAGNPFDFMSSEAAKVPIGSEGIICLDFFQGNRTPYKNLKAKGAFYGLSLKHTQAEIYRSILESVAFGTRNIVSNFIAQGCNISSMVACGGITKDPVWIEIIADAVGIPIVITENSQAGTLGCCVAAAVGTGVYNDFNEATSNMVRKFKTVEPHMSNHKIYNDIYTKYLDLYESLKHMMG